jgi:hypothetical protein
MRKRNWPGCPNCRFRDNVETTKHLFFSCGVAKFVSGAVGACVGAKTCPGSLWQSLAWLYAYLPGDERFYTLLLAAIYWSIWTIRNKVTFEKYAVKSHEVILFTMCFFSTYWAGLYKAEDAEKIRGGVKKLITLAADWRGRLKRQFRYLRYW